MLNLCRPAFYQLIASIIFIVVVFILTILSNGILHAILGMISGGIICGGFIVASQIFCNMDLMSVSWFIAITTILLAILLMTLSIYGFFTMKEEKTV